MFKLEIKTANDAFQNSEAGIEIQRILNEVADKVYDGATTGNIKDVNGNTVGSWELSED